MRLLFPFRTIKDCDEEMLDAELNKRIFVVVAVLWSPLVLLWCGMHELHRLELSVPLAAGVHR